MKIIYLTKNESFQIPDVFPGHEVVLKSHLLVNDEILSNTKLLVIDNLKQEYEVFIKKLTSINLTFNVLILIEKTDFNILNFKNHNFRFLISPFSKEELMITLTRLVSSDHLFFNYQESATETLNLLKVILNNTKTGYIVTKNNRRQKFSENESLYMNDAMKNIIKMNLSKFQKIKFADIVFPEDRDIEKPLFEQMRKGELDSYQFEVRIYDLEKNLKWVKIIKNLIQNLDDNNYLSLYSVEDITRKQQVRELLYDSKQTMSILSSSFPGLVYRCLNDENWTFEYLSVGIESLTGYTQEDFINKKIVNYNDLILPKYQSLVRETIDEAIVNKTSFSLEYQIKKKDGTNIWVFEKGGIIFDDKENSIYVEGVIFNIDNEKQKEAALIYNLNHHYLTNLYNRIYLENFLARESTLPSFKKSIILKLKVIYLRDLVKFYGMYYVNEIIRSIAVTLKPMISDDIRLFYSQDNHFVIYVREGLKNYTLEDIISKIEQRLSKFFNFSQISFSLGIMPLNNYHFINSDHLLKHLLITVDQETLEKTSFTVNHFDVLKQIQNDLEKDVIDHLELIVNKENDESFYLVSQPIYDLRTNKIVGTEMLARLNHPVHGFISPLTFIKLAEQTKIIDELGLLIFNKTFSFMRTLKEHNLDHLLVAINISAIQINSKNFINNIKDLIEQYQINPKKLVFELTESVLVTNVELANQVFREVKKMGILISIDDFGTGFSSLDIQNSLEVDIIKIDRSFTELLESADDEKSVIKDIISMSHRMKRVVVCEGVERQIDIDYLKANNCDYAQGYFISKPLKVGEVLKLLKNNDSEMLQK